MIRAANGTTEFIDARETAPAAARPDMFAGVGGRAWVADAPFMPCCRQMHIHTQTHTPPTTTTTPPPPTQQTSTQHM